MVSSYGFYKESQIKMNWFVGLPNKFKDFTWHVAMIFIFLYLGFYTLYGDRGLFHYLHLLDKIERAQQVATNYHNERVKLENKIKLLSSESLDLDLLDERAKSVLNLMRDDEFIIIDEN